MGSEAYQSTEPPHPWKTIAITSGFKLIRDSRQGFEFPWLNFLLPISMDFIYLKFKSYEVESHMDLPMIIIYEYFQYCLMLISFFYLLSCFLISSYKSFEKPYSQI